jgi:hypothetical protein
VPEKRGRKVVLTCPDCNYEQTEIPTVVIEAGSRMTEKPGGPKPKDDVVVPPISASSFEDAVARLLKVKPPKGKG